MDNKLSELSKPVAWFTDDYLIDKSATTYSEEIAQRWRDKPWFVGNLHSQEYVSALLAELEATFQDPAVDYVKAKPSIDQMAGDAWIMPVVLEAYEEAQREIAYLQAACDFAGEILKNKRAPGGGS
ncbi:hypothetical protein [Serratia quinivorans]|uniref:hypothetical protein n=1 Tax=Serratia quinivorans TaxID=137545 RepID=UPI0034C60A66